jgi:ribulose-phosphate 3-epimerase
MQVRCDAARDLCRKATASLRLNSPRHICFSAGLVFNPATPLDYLKYVMDKVDIVLLMSVNPGFGGQSFIPSTLDKLKEARKMIDESGYDIRLEVDGGVGIANIREICEAGADMFVAGSAVFKGT